MRGVEGNPIDIMFTILPTTYDGQPGAGMDGRHQFSEKDAGRTAGCQGNRRGGVPGKAGFSSLALKTDLDNKQRDYIRKIQQSGTHLLGIINDILDFSKIEAGKLSVEHI